MMCRIETLNAEAVHWLSHGSFSEASKASSCALRQLLPHVLRSGNGDDDGDGMFQRAADNLTMRCVPLLPKIPRTQDDRVFSVFAFALFHVRTKQSVWSLENYRRAGASTVYNMALSYHLQGLQGSGNRQHLETALGAYKAAKDLLSSSTPNLLEGSDDVQLLAMAILNNEGHIFEQLYERELAVERLGQLHCLIPHTTWSAESEHFHTTAVLFPTASAVHLPAPVA